MFLVSSCIYLNPIHWNQVLNREWSCSWSGTDRPGTVTCEVIMTDMCKIDWNQIVMKRESWGVFLGSTVYVLFEKALNSGPVAGNSEILCGDISSSFRKRDSIHWLCRKSSLKITWRGSPKPPLTIAIENNRSYLCKGCCGIVPKNDITITQLFMTI